MPRKLKERPLGYEPYRELARSQMHNLVFALNGAKPRISVGSGGKKRTRVKRQPSESQTELRRLVQIWMDSGPDLIKMFKQEPGLEDQTRYGQTLFYPMHDGRGHLDWSPAMTGPRQPPFKDEALEDFMILITNPLWELLGGPCSRCGDYYLKKTKRQKTYCSRGCGTTATAASTMRRRRQQERNTKLQKARDAIKEWGEKKRRANWKQWVSDRTRYTTNWITRAVNKGDLHPPDGSAIH
jgi:hypothetical protein